ncbi:MAG: T9SS type A sorting domain-containing protein [Candidatus Kapaibacteriota bacterium]
MRVKSRVAWDGSFDLREAIEGVYDSMGRKVEGKERIQVTIRDKGWAEVEWECSGVPPGVYFILVRYTGGTETIPVIVE